MNRQSDLQLFDTIYDAIGADVMACGGVKKTAAKLWPNKPASTAEGRLRAAMSASHDQELGADEVTSLIRLAASNGAFNTACFMCSTAGGEFKRIEPRTRMQLLVESIERNQQSLNRQYDQLQDALAAVAEQDAREGRG